MSVIRLMQSEENKPVKLNDKEDKSEQLYRTIFEWESFRKKGQIIIHFDGSGTIPKVVLQSDL
jgi:hypothetical protein